ncbi:hypothetical protein CRUP_012286 [Coryphaenoides rupestris]|nr:hypothetical protein CRUP_012286 [Coryphaenoides rupestris]
MCRAGTHERPGLRGAPGYSLEQAHHLPIEMDPLIGDYPAPRAVLTGHDHEVVCVSVCAELGLVISGAKEGPCLVHTITGDLLRALEGPDLCQRPRLISVSSEGHCIICYERGRFCNFSINGKLLAQMEVNDSSRVRPQWDMTLITGMASGSIVAFNIDFNRWHYEHQNRY